MRVAFISYWACPRTSLGVLSSGGMNVYLFNLANELEKRNVQVDIFTRSHQEKHESIVYLSENVCLIHLRVGEKSHEKGCKIFATEIEKFISQKKLNYDILHAHYYYSGISGILLKKILKIPLVVTFHTLGEMKKKYAGIIDLKRIKSEKEIVKDADAILASTELERNDLLQSYKADIGKIAVASPGVNHQVFKPLDKGVSRKKLKLSENLRYILFAGRIDPVKGITLLLESVCRLNQNKDFKKNTRLLIIGGDVKSRSFWSSPEAARIKRFISDRKLGNCTDFIGSVPHKRLALYYSASDIVVMPSVYESFGLVVLEAMASGACVLASGVGGLKYLIKHNENGFLFKNADINDLSNKLEILLKNESKRLMLGRNAFKSSRNYSWSLLTDRIISLYGKLKKNYV